MDSAYLSALSALGGSIVGGLTAGITTWLSLRAEARAGQRAHDKLRREELYKDFIVAASQACSDALMTNEPKIPQIVALYAMVSRMRVLSSPSIVACAEKMMVTTVDTYFAPNKSFADVYKLMKSGKEHEVGLDLLKEFSEIAREELQTL